MRKVRFGLLSVIVAVIMCTLLIAKDRAPVKVDVHETLESTSTGNFGPSSHATYTSAYRMKVIINGENALLECWNRPQNCTYLGSQVYDGELSGKDIWISSQVPVTHKQVRDHWRIIGSW